MQNMKLKELKEQLNENFHVYSLEVVKYLPLIQKQQIARQAVEDLVYYENGIAYVDRTQKTVTLGIALLMHYCNVEIEEDDNSVELIDVLDVLIKHGFYNEIEKMIGDDLVEFYAIVDDMIENEKVKNNSLEAVLAKGLTKFVEVVDKNTSPKQIKSLIKALSKEFKGFEPGKMKELQNMLMGLNGGKVDDVKSAKKNDISNVVNKK